MNILLIGCEFTGKTTLAAEIVDWCEENLGASSHFHDPLHDSLDGADR